jgi:hypothetical protein
MGVAYNIHERNAYKILVSKLEGKRPLGRSRHRRIILKWILNMVGGWGLNASNWHMHEVCEHGEESSASTKGGKFLDLLICC